MTHAQIIASELGLAESRVAAAIELIDEGNTIPFIARYRKEATGSMDDGALRTLGRVDHGDAFLDTEALERERGITIFAKQAVLDCGGTHITLLDTPGHVDFSAEAERTLQVLDYAILVISGTDGVQGHTRTLWRLLERYGVPTFLFINKMDLAGADRAALLTDLQKSFGACVDLGAEPNERDEHAALTDEAALEELLERGALSDDTLAALISARKIFPCCFGSALKNEGVEEFLQLLTRFTREPARHCGQKCSFPAARPTSSGFTPVRSSARSTRRARARSWPSRALRTPIQGRGSGRRRTAKSLCCKAF